MTEIETIKRDLAAFGAAYDYDTTYVADFVDSSLGAYKAFAAAQPLGRYRSTLPREAHWVAGITAALTDDCGACAQLGLKHAVQDGVDRALLRTLLDAPETLPGPLADVYAHARGVCERSPDDPERAERLRRAYGDEGVAELAVCIVGSRLFPMLKRALSRMSTCHKPTLDF